MMGAQGADHQGAIGARHVAQPGQFFHVDQALVLDQPLFHRQEKLRAAGIDFRALTQAPQQLGSFRDAFRFFQAESSEHYPSPSNFVFTAWANSSRTWSALRLMMPWPKAASLPKMSTPATKPRIVLSPSSRRCTSKSSFMRLPILL